MPAEVLVDAATVAAAPRSADRPPVLLDVRWKLGDPDGPRWYREGHIPGAVYVDLERELAAPAEDPVGEGGRHPLPSLTDLQAAARSWGVRGGDAIVVYDDAGGTAAARAWWLLRWAGIEGVRLLDGGLGAWRAAGLPVESGTVEPEPGDVTLPAVVAGEVAAAAAAGIAAGDPLAIGSVGWAPGMPTGGLPVLSAEEAGDLARDGVLLDARAGERFRGEVEPMDPAAGHIPGAVSAPTTENLAPDGRFLPAAELRARFEALGVRPGVAVGASCGSGIHATHELAALAIAGFDGALYAASWSGWVSDPDRPIATGDQCPDS